MGNPYPRLTYLGNVSDISAGQLLGWDETLRPYEVIDFELCGMMCVGGNLDGTPRTHTHVYLQYASADTIREHGQEFFAAAQMRGLL